MSSAPMTVAVLPGDGIGPEVMDVAVKVLEHAGGLFGQSFNFKHAPVGGAAVATNVLQHRNPLVLLWGLTGLSLVLLANVHLAFLHGRW